MPRSRPWLRLFSAQESGLIAVIVLMMIGLTLATPQISRRDRITLSPGAVAEQRGDDIVVTTGSTSRTYRAADGYELRGSSALVHTYKVNRFLNAENLIGIAKEASFIAIMAVGITGIIIMGGIDLSIGAVYALAGVIGGMALHSLNTRPDVSAATAITVGLLVPCLIGAACGALNGIATVGLAVHPFIITLGGMAIYRGIAFVATKGQSISEFPDSFTTGLFRAQFLGLNPVTVALMLLVAAAGAIMLRFTVLGRRTFAIGGNETAARYAGVPVGRVKVTVYMLAGLSAGLAASAMLGYYGAVSSAAGSGYELDVIAAAVVGGASLSGGRGSAIGAMLGAIVIQLINNAITVLQIDENYKQIIVGLAVIIAVVVDQAKHRLSLRATR